MASPSLRNRSKTAVIAARSSPAERRPAADRSIQAVTRSSSLGSSAIAAPSASERIHASRGGRGSLKGITVSQPPRTPKELAMTTATATTPTAGLILALDLGKYKTVACAYAGDPATARFESLPTDRDHLRKLFAKHRPAVAVCEACALAGWVHDLCAELGLPCKVANTASEAWKFKHTTRKTDKADALRLAQLEALGQLPAVATPPTQPRQWRALIAARQALVGRRGACQNRVRAVLVGQGLPAPRGAKAWAEL